MLRAGVGLSIRSEAATAAEEACAAALAGSGPADAALLLAGPGLGDTLPGLLDVAVSALGTDAVVGASGHGVLGAGREHEGAPGLVVLALAGLDCHPFLLADVEGDERAAFEEVALRLEGGPRPEDLVVVFPDPRNLDPGGLLSGMQEALGPARIVGACAADPISGDPLQWCGRKLASGGIAGMVLRGSRPPRIGVTQACRPVTPPLTVTRARGHWVLEIDGRPALEVYREVARGPLAEDLRRAASFLLVALPVAGADESLSPGTYLVRHVVGFEPEANAFAIPDPVQPGQRIALALRDPQSAREDLKGMLEGLAGEPPACGLYFDCCARGSGFFGVSGLEAGYLDSALGTAAVAGIFGSSEIGPIGGRAELLTYTGVLALLDG